MWEHRRNLKGAHEAKSCHIGGFHRRDVLPLIKNLAARRRQKFGQQIETSGLASTIGADQCMDAAPLDPQIYVVDRDEPGKLLTQAFRFENELVSQSDFPRQPSRGVSCRVWPICVM